ncbi:hypothetical protein KM925_24960 [Priestia megaterium]|uniref:hypothetical protein n=1 Tax=Priestia megaterium TaxID=1404 RepID=UPI001C21702F|nr:hypothetical protein [Priestia megaterium]MBU8589147.1 hypothetical protein [Priestia megaterium]
MKKTIRILANNQPNILLHVTNLLLKYRVKINDFISSTNEESGKILITVTMHSDYITFKQLLNQILKIHEVVDVQEIIE